jgi:phage FluMu protein Com
LIEISLTTALILYSAVIVAGGFFIWLQTEVVTRKAYLVLEKQYLWRCTFCSYIYLDTDALRHSTCPQCHSINVQEDKQARFIPISKSLQALEEVGERPTSRRNPSRGKRPGAKRRGPRKRSR